MASTDTWKVIKAGHGATINIKAELGFMNEKVPLVYMKKLVYVLFLAETSDGRKVHFARIGYVTCTYDVDYLLTIGAVARI